MECPFCKFVSKEIKTLILYEDSKVMVILDINPAQKGHCFIIPKLHYNNVDDVPDEILGHMFMIAKHVSKIMLKKLKANGVNLLISDGSIAGQKAPHFLMHIIPQYEGMDIFDYEHHEVPYDELKDLIRRLNELRDM